MNMASRMQSTINEGNQIQLSESTAKLLVAAGKTSWIRPREDFVKVKGKGVVRTYWAVQRQLPGRRFGDDGSAYTTSTSSSLMSPSSGDDTLSDMLLDDDDDLDAAGTNEFCQVYLDLNPYKTSSNITLSDGDERSRRSNNTNKTSLSGSAKTDPKTKRTVVWLTDILKDRLKYLVAERESTGGHARGSMLEGTLSLQYGTNILDEVVECLPIPKLRKWDDESLPHVAPIVISQLQDYIMSLAEHYNPESYYHSVEHAGYMVMSAVKLLKRINVTLEGSCGVSNPTARKHEQGLHDSTYGISSDAVGQFAIIFVALIHGMGYSDESGAASNSTSGGRYDAQSHALDVAWKSLMENVTLRELRQCIFADNQENAERLRQYVANLLVATDIYDDERQFTRDERWERVFAHDAGAPLSHESNLNNTATMMNIQGTAVLELMVQVSVELAHTMQHWSVYCKWTERKFLEAYMSATLDNKSDNDLIEYWYSKELEFLKKHVLPSAKKLGDCGMFGHSSQECLSYAQMNLETFKEKGRGLIQEWIKQGMSMDNTRHSKRTTEPVVGDLTSKTGKMVGGFSREDIRSFTSDDLMEIIQILVSKGRHLMAKHAKNPAKYDDSTISDAAKAWSDAIAIYDEACSTSTASKGIDPLIIYTALKGMLNLIENHNEIAFFTEPQGADGSRSKTNIEELKAIYGQRVIKLQILMKRRMSE